MGNYLLISVSENNKYNFRYLKYSSLEDMFKIILSSAQSALGISSLLYFLNYKNQNLMFIYNSSIGSSLIHYNILSEKPLTKFIQLNKQSGEYKYIDDVGNDPHSIYIPILELENTTLEFPLN
ncbi:MAG TPA: hypothetical protein VFY77_00215 [Nitrososphaeraceae archaeon]|jgi:hypothetical protein|nr:hypothetical protein [Nitrososphaeraceae archaeon]